MKHIEDASVIEYRNELILELTGIDEFGDVGVVSYQFAYGDESPNVIHPKQVIEDDHLPTVRETLEKESYRLTTPTP